MARTVGVVFGLSVLFTSTKTPLSGGDRAYYISVTRSRAFPRLFSWYVRGSPSRESSGDETDKILVWVARWWQNGRNNAIRAVEDQREKDTKQGRVLKPRVVRASETVRSLTQCEHEQKRTRKERFGDIDFGNKGFSDICVVQPFPFPNSWLHLSGVCNDRVPEGTCDLK